MGEADRIMDCRADAAVVGQFVDTCREPSRRLPCLCSRDPDTGQWQPTQTSTQAILEQYFRIDMDAVEDERQIVLAALREEADDAD